jgi:hypothetical protein
VPDDVEQRVPTLTWSRRADWCEDCSALDTPWATTEEQKQSAVGMRVDGNGASPSLFIATIRMPDGSANTVFGSDGVPQVAFSIDTDQPRPCGRVWGLQLGRDGLIGAWFVAHVTDDYEFLLVPNSEPGRLMESADATFTWKSEFTRGRGINDLWFSRDLIVADFSGSIGIGDTRSGEAIEINEHATGLAGSYNEAQVVGRTVFASRYTGDRSEWFVIEEGRIRPFLGDEQHDVDFLVTDGETIVFKQGVDPYDSPAGSLRRRLYARYDLYRARYTADPASLAPELLMRDVAPGLYHARLANGYLAASYLTAHEPREGGAMVVRVADGRAWMAQVPPGWSWGYRLFPSATELWGAVTRYYAASKYETILRMPYEQMSVVQNAAPE